jgi:hypothetical protein
MVSPTQKISSPEILSSTNTAQQARLTTPTKTTEETRAEIARKLNEALNETVSIMNSLGLLTVTPAKITDSKSLDLNVPPPSKDSPLEPAKVAEAVKKSIVGFANPVGETPDNAIYGSGAIIDVIEDAKGGKFLKVITAKHLSIPRQIEVNGTIYNVAARKEDRDPDQDKKVVTFEIAKADGKSFKSGEFRNSFKKLAVATTKQEQVETLRGSNNNVAVVGIIPTATDENGSRASITREKANHVSGNLAVKKVDIEGEEIAEGIPKDITAHPQYATRSFLYKGQSGSVAIGYSLKKGYIIAGIQSSVNENGEVGSVKGESDDPYLVLFESTVDKKA